MCIILTVMVGVSKGPKLKGGMKQLLPPGWRVLKIYKNNKLHNCKVNVWWWEPIQIQILMLTWTIIYKINFILKYHS